MQSSDHITDLAPGKYLPQQSHRQLAVIAPPAEDVDLGPVLGGGGQPGSDSLPPSLPQEVSQGDVDTPSQPAYLTLRRRPHINHRHLPLHLHLGHHLRQLVHRHPVLPGEEAQTGLLII